LGGRMQPLERLQPLSLLSSSQDLPINYIKNHLIKFFSNLYTR
jgi:hypothetical protein